MKATADSSLDLSAQIKVSARVGREIKAWMARYGQRQKDVAEVLGIAQPGVSARLRGQVPFDISELTILASHFGISLGELLGSQIVNETGPRPAKRDEGQNELPRLDSNQQPFD